MHTGTGSEPGILTVSQATSYIKGLVEEDALLQDLWIRGEVSNLSHSTAGHIYFTLKDETSSMRCILWRSLAEAQAHLPAGGQAVILHGRVSVYEVQGAYQLYVDLVQPLGLGALHLKFEALKTKLEAEGLFAPERKRSLPPFPRSLGVVTSPQAAAWRDILRMLKERYPLVEVVLAPAAVQGEGAPSEIAEALRALGKYTCVQAILLARGGGSLEELWAFNEEEVGRAIYESPVPVVSGVGHETDFTIADFVADVRAPTPTAAASMAVPDVRDCQEALERQAGRLLELASARLVEGRQNLAEKGGLLRRLSPRAKLEGYRQGLDELSHRMRLCSKQNIAMRWERVRGLGLRLESLSPTTTLSRGYSITSRLDTGEIVKSVTQVKRGHRIGVQVKDGDFAGTVD